jgi:hypothetical protein
MLATRFVLLSTIASALWVAAPTGYAQESTTRKAQEVAPTVEEDETGIDFPTWLDLDLDGKGDELTRHHLLGTGVREKTIFYVDVYGMAMYADKEALGREHSALAKKISPKKAGKDKKLAAALLEGKVALTLRLVFARDIDAEDVREAFEDWLQPRLEKAVKAVKDPTKRAALKKSTTANLVTFRDFFSVDITEGDELIMVWETDGSLHTILQGKARKVLNDVHLCRAMFDCYIGEDAAEPKARKSFLTGAWRLARAWTAPVATDETEGSDADKN